MTDKDDDDFFPILYNILSGKTDKSLIKLVDGTNNDEKKGDENKEPRINSNSNSNNLYDDIMKDIIDKMTDGEKEFIKNLYHESKEK